MIFDTWATLCLFMLLGGSILLTVLFGAVAVYNKTETKRAWLKPYAVLEIGYIMLMFAVIGAGALVWA